MYHSARIIAVDDSSADLEKLENQIKKRGSACLSIKFTGASDLPADPIIGIRLIFMDINLLSGSPANAGPQTFSTNLAVIDKLISEDNGPYALITWTTTSEHENLIQHLNARLTKKKRPFFSVCLDKNIYLDDPDGLLAKLQELRDTSPQMAALMDWEKRVQDAVIQVLDDLITLAGGDNLTEASKNMDNLMSWLARAAHGKTNAPKDCLAAVNDALSPVLHDKISRICSENIPNALWNKAVTKIDCASTLSDEQIGKVNLALHVSKHVEKVLPSDRGGVVILPDAWLEEQAFKDRFHSDIEAFKRDELKITPNEEPLQWIMVPYQASCDHAQARPGPVPLVLGIIRKKPVSKNQLRGSCWVSPVFYEDNWSAYEIVINCRYITTMNPEKMDKDIYKLWGRLREQLMNDLSAHIHNYGQRLGIVKLPE